MWHHPDGEAGPEAEDDDASFGALLRQYRLAAGLTQEALAERAGLSQRGIQGLEWGERRPYRDTVRRLVVALELPAEAIAAFEAAGAPAPRRHSTAWPRPVRSACGKPAGRFAGTTRSTPRTSSPCASNSPTTARPALPAAPVTT
jgi:DNA-binding XRE family transcriptional regulator